MELEIGRVGRAHGVRGEVSVTLLTDRVSRLAPGTELSSERGSLRVASARPHQRGWLVRFEGVEDRAAAEALRGTVLLAEAEPSEAGELWVHEVVGVPVALADGTSIGSVNAVQANPASDLLVLDGGELVPVAFVVDERRDGGRLVGLVVELPEGLLDL